MLTNKTRVSDRRGRPRKHPFEPRKTPSQDRAQDTVGVILEAAAHILEKHGLDGYNTNAVAAKAGVSIGSLYQYFPNKDAITLALIRNFEEELDVAIGSWMDLDDSLTVQERLRKIVQSLVAVHRSRVSLNQILEQVEERLMPQKTKTDSKLFQEVRRNLLRHRSELPAPVTTSMVVDCITIASAMVDSTLIAGVSARESERRVMQAVSGYLFYKS